MASKILHATQRVEFGTKASRIARRAGLIPAVVYGHQKPEHLLIKNKEFHHQFKHISENEIVTLKLENSEIQVLIKSHQSNIINGSVVHLDFFEIEKGKSLKIHVPVQLTGTPRGVREGGILEVLLHEIHIECLPKDIPENIVIDITELQGHAPLHVSDIKAIKGVKFITPSEQVIASVTHAKVESEAEATETDENEPVDET